MRHFVESTGQRADLGKSYSNVHALRGVNVTVRQGEVTCVLGDNGTGKSTLIKIVVSGLHDYTEGTMKLRRPEVHREGARRRARGHLHHPQPASRLLVGNHFVVLKLGRVALDAHRDGLTLEQLTAEMAGGQELTELSHELRGAQPGKVVTPHVVEHGGVAAPTLDGDGDGAVEGASGPGPAVADVREAVDDRPPPDSAVEREHGHADQRRDIRQRLLEAGLRVHAGDDQRERVERHDRSSEQSRVAGLVHWYPIRFQVAFTRS